MAGFSTADEDGDARPDVPFDLEGALRAADARVEPAAPWQPKLRVDGRPITGQNPASGALVFRAIVDALRRSA